MTPRPLILCVFSLDAERDVYTLIGTLAQDGSTTGIGEAVKRWRRLRRDSDGKPERWIFWDDWEEYLRLSHGKGNGYTIRLALPADRLMSSLRTVCLTRRRWRRGWLRPTRCALCVKVSPSSRP